MTIFVIDRKLNQWVNDLVSNIERNWRGKTPQFFDPMQRGPAGIEWDEMQKTATVSVFDLAGNKKIADIAIKYPGSPTAMSEWIPVQVKHLKPDDYWKIDHLT